MSQSAGGTRTTSLGSEGSHRPSEQVIHPVTEEQEQLCCNWMRDRTGPLFATLGALVTAQANDEKWLALFRMSETVFILPEMIWSPLVGLLRRLLRRPELTQAPRGWKFPSVPPRDIPVASDRHTIFQSCGAEAREALRAVQDHLCGQLAAVWGSFSLILDHFGISIGPGAFQEWFATAFLRSLLYSVEGVFKFAYADAFCHWTHQQERPVPPKTLSRNCLFSFFPPKEARAFKKLSFPWAKGRRERYYFAFSVLQAKKGTRCIPWWDIEAGLQTSVSRLSTPRPDGALPLVLELYDSISRTVRECYPRYLSKPVVSNVLLPSQSAHNESKRREGGATSYLRPMMGDGGLQTVQSSGGEVEIMRHQDAELAYYWSQRSRGKILSRVHEVLEPFKLRTISTGPSVDYYCGKYINRILHSRLGQIPQFRFTHEVVTESGLSDLFLWAGEVAASVDYEAATDNLKSRYTNWCWRSICDCLSWDREVYEWGMTLLSGTCLDFNGHVVEQNNGQLMGCPLSFPILCLINLACLRLVEERQAGRQLRLCELRCRINGDDGLLPMRPEHYPFLKEVCTEAGLIPSIGKNYLSADFGMINSQLYIINRDGLALGRFTERVSYLNVGLIKGTGRVLSDTRKPRYAFDDRGGWGDLGQRSTSLILGLRKNEQKLAMSAFIAWNGSLLKSTRRDWYLPTNVGGLGLPWVQEGEPPGLSKGAALVASYASSVMGLSLARPEFLNCTPQDYRNRVPFIRVNAAEYPEVLERIRDDSVWFWTERVNDVDRTPSSEEQRFQQALKLAKNSGVAPNFKRGEHHWTAIPEFQLRPQPQLIPWSERLPALIRSRERASFARLAEARRRERERECVGNRAFLLLRTVLTHTCEGYQ